MSNPPGERGNPGILQYPWLILFLPFSGGQGGRKDGKAYQAADRESLGIPFFSSSWQAGGGSGAGSGLGGKTAAG